MIEILAAVLTVTAGVYLYHLIEWVYYKLENKFYECPQLEKLKDEAKLSDVSKTITMNYTTYYDCAVKHDAFIEWYQIQKHIYESVK